MLEMLFRLSVLSSFQKQRSVFEPWWLRCARLHRLIWCSFVVYFHCLSHYQCNCVHAAPDPHLFSQTVCISHMTKVYFPLFLRRAAEGSRRKHFRVSSVIIGCQSKMCQNKKFVFPKTLLLPTAVQSRNPLHYWLKWTF